MPSLAEPLQGPVPTELASNGCFETMRAYGGCIFRLGQHLDRLYGSAKYLGLGTPADRPRLRTRLTQALRASGLREAVVRIALLPRPRHGGEPFASTILPSIVVQPVQLPPPQAYRHGIRVAVVPTRKFSIGAIDPRAKYSARLSSVMAVAEAQLRGVDEALFMDGLGGVTESTASNFFIVARGALVTPPCWLGLLHGVTREVVGELARALRIPLHEVPMTRHEVYTADEAFLSSTIKEVLAVTTVDGRQIGSGVCGPVTASLHRAFRALVAREVGHDPR